jgi:thymidylate synthase
MNKWSNYGKWRHPEKRKKLMKNIDIKNNTLDKQYTDLLQDILDNGVKKETRNGGTFSVFGRQIRHNMKDGFPLLTTKKMAWKTMVTELLWFLRGDTNIKYLVDNNCHIWDGDAYRSYCDNYPDVEKTFQYEGSNIEVRKMTQEEFINQIKTDDEFAKKWGDLGPVYGKQWRSWNDNIDQISDLIKQLKENPDSRRLLLSAWNPSELDQMVLPPCHYGFQVYTRELSRDERIDLYIKKYGDSGMDYGKYKDTIPTRAISLMWNQRSVDTFLGLPFNIASYGLLLEIIAKAVNMVPDELIGNLGDVHLYSNHIEQAKEQIGREMSDEEIIEYYYKNIDTKTKWKKLDNKYFYYSEENNMWFEHSTSDIYFGMRPHCLKRTREPFPLPTLNINTEFWPTESGECGIGLLDAITVFKSFTNDNFCKCLLEEDIQLSNYRSHEKIKAPLSN